MWAADGSLSFRIVMWDVIDQAYGYDVTWNGEAKTLSATEVN